MAGVIHELVLQNTLLPIVLVQDVEGASGGVHLDVGGLGVDG